MREGEAPPFAYSIGITSLTGAPEVVVVGLKQPMAHFIVNEYNDRVRAGKKIEVGGFYSGFIEGFDVFVERVSASTYDDYFGQAIDFYGHRRFKVIQVLYPTTKGVWPWQEDAPESFKVWQPILANIPRT